MPLLPGSDPSTISANIHELTAHGSRPRSHSQIVAIALANADRHPHRAAGGIGAPHPFHLMHAMPAMPHPAQPMSPSQGTPWWTRSEARSIDQPMRQSHRGFADGGGLGTAEESPWWERSEGRAMADIPFHQGGLIDSSIAGRTDRLPLAVGAESHVLPADTVSATGQGGTKAGAKLLMASLSTGPWGVPVPHAPHAHTIPSPPHPTALADGGRPYGDTAILAAGSELVVPPEIVEGLGRRGIEAGMCKKGESPIECGHRLIDEMIARIRKFQIDWLKHAPPPKKSTGGAVA